MFLSSTCSLPAGKSSERGRESISVYQSSVS
uniref:Uncharacterized protein n=1 Tax=Anguilla anguilla TaxID=7936 RepID=A0A0E9TZW7_ANGAN